MAAATILKILKIGLKGISEDMAYICMKFCKHTKKRCPTIDFAVKIHFPRNPK